MQLILVPGGARSSRTLFLTRWHALAAFAAVALLAILFSGSIALVAVRELASWPNSSLRDALVSRVMSGFAAVHRTSVSSIDATAVTLGRLQARVSLLDIEGERVAKLAGLAPSELHIGGVPGRGSANPGDDAHDFTMDDIKRLLGHVSAQIDRRAERMEFLESQLFDATVRKRMMPTSVPVDDAHIGSGFGTRADPFTGAPAMHEGLDFVAETGTPIHAAGGGIVVFVGRHPEFGNMVEIYHGNGYTSRYAHCSKTFVKEGELVAAGQRIALVGETGRTTGPHLHFEVRYHDVAQNPNRFLGADVQRLARVTGFAKRPIGD